MPAPDPVPHGKTREEIAEFAVAAYAEMLDKLNDVLDKCNDIFDKVSE